MPIRARVEEDVVWAGEAIQSLMTQSYKDWELIIVNDRSTVSLAPLKPLVKNNDNIFARKSKQPGVAHARNLGAQEARGELLLPLDHDDLFPPKALEVMLEAWEAGGKDFGVVYGDVISFGPDYQRHMDMPTFLFQTLLNTLIMPIGSLHARAAWQEIGGWKDKFQGGLEDWAYWIEMTVNGYHGYHVEEVTYHYRRHAHGRLAALRTNEDKFAQQKALIHQEFQAYYDGKEPKMCRGCGKGRPGRFRPRGAAAPAPPAAAAAFSATVSPQSLVIVKYIGSKKASFGITGKATGWKYSVPGGKGCIVEGPNGKPGVHPNDAQFFRRYDSGRAFMVEQAV
jgi:hypothetical protein